MRAKRFITIILIIMLICVGYNVYAEDTEVEIENNVESIEENTEESTEENTEENIEEENLNGEPRIYSESAILMEKNTGKVLYAKDVYSRKYPASTTKILTAIIAIENCDLNQKMTASQNAVQLPDNHSYTKANIQAGESFTLDELLGVLMLQSANEAANVIAENIAGSTEKFAEMMNEKAKEVGCIDTHFVNANGIHDENHYTTSYDMAAIASYCMRNESFRKYANMMECRLPNTDLWGEEQIAESGERHFYNTNKLLIPGDKYYYPYCTGIKTGYTTPAKNCLIASSNKDGFELIAVILHAEQTEEKLSARYMDTISLFEYGYNNFSKEQIYDESGYDTKKQQDNMDEEIEREESRGIEEAIKQTEEFIEEKIPEASSIREKGFSIILIFGIICVLTLVIIGVVVYFIVRKLR